MANTPKADEATPKELTHAQVAALVVREVPEIDPKTKKPTGETKKIKVSAEEVFAFKNYGDYVVVITTDGQKLRGDK